MNFEYTMAELNALTSLRARGCAVTVFSPDELRGTSPEQVENAMVSRGFDAIDDLESDSDDSEEE